MDGKKTEVRTFSAFHYDVAYRKTYSEYLEKSLGIIDAGLALLAKYPQFIFTIEQVILIREYLERFPSMKEPAKKFVREGRLIFTPGMFTMPDVNIPSGENFLRNFQLGREWLADNLQAEPKICWMADIFGHHPQIPQMANICGYTAYLFERGKNGGDDTVFLWEGIDGSRILTQWEIDTYYGIALPFTYALPNRNIDWMAGYIEKMLLDPLRENSAVKSFIISPIGGDFRVPEENFISVIREFNTKSRNYRIAFHSPEKAFDEISEKYSANLPVFQSDFNPVMQGCLSSRIRIKQYNRRLESMAYAIELLATMAGRTNKDSDNLWEKIVINSFHDIICGSLVDAACRETLDFCRQAEASAMKAISAGIADSENKGKRPSGNNMAVTLFNSLPYRRTEIVEIPVKSLDGTTGALVTDREGIEYPVQVTGSTADQETGTLDILGKETGNQKKLHSGMHNLCLAAEVSMPATGIKTFNVVLTGGKKEADKNFLKVSGRLLENNFLKVVLADNGLITSLYDKENDVELVQRGLSALTPMGMNNVIIQPDYGDLWCYYSGPVNGSMLYSQETNDPMPESGINLQRRGLSRTHAVDANYAGPAEIRILERGPVRACIEVRNPKRNLTSKIFLARKEKMLRFKTTFVPVDKRYRIRVAFPTSIKNGKIIHSIPFGFTERNEGEYPSQNWMEYSDGEKGLCLLNRGLPGNNVTDGVMMLSLFRAVAMEDEKKNGEWFEENIEHTFEYALRPFGRKDTRYNPARTGEMFNHPFHAVCHANTRNAPDSSGFIELESDGAEISCIRRRGNAIELRIYETAGRPEEIVVFVSFKVISCNIVDMRYREKRKIKMRGNQIRLFLKPFEIVTCLLRTDLR